MELEIGFGRGLFLYQRAEVLAASEGAPGRILGIEVKRKLGFQVGEHCARRGLGNVLVWAADARDVLSRIQPGGQIERVFMHFPDPWWKKRHQKRRLTGDAMLDQIARVLRNGGEFLMQTDVVERAERHRLALLEHPEFQLGGEDGWVVTNTYQARSNREVRAEEDGLPVHRVLGIRR